MSTPLWFLGKGGGPLRDGHPTFHEELAKMPPIADSCYRAPRKVTSWRTCPTCGSKATKILHLTDDGNPPYECQICSRRYDWPAQRSQEPDEQSQD